MQTLATPRCMRMPRLSCHLEASICCPPPPAQTQLTGTLPAYIAALPALTEVKVQNNMLLGTIPNVFGRMTRGVRRFQVRRACVRARQRAFAAHVVRTPPSC